MIQDKTRKIRIVVIEDDPAVNEGLVMILQKSGYEVSSFLTVDEFDNAFIEKADIYLLDRQLNGTDGLQLCQRLKNNESTKHIPVIIMSASPDTEQYMQQAGGNAFLEKPFSRKQLIALLERVFQQNS